jgi:hypothetical protein
MFRWILIGVVAGVVLPAQASFDYALDDGHGTWQIGPSDWDAEILWGNYFEAEPGYELIDTISVSFPSRVPVGREVTAILFEDPTDDLDPTDAIPLSEALGVTVATGADEFVTFDIPDAAISGGFFVGIKLWLAQHDSGARMDEHTDSGRSWIFFDDEIDVDDLGGSPLYYNMSDTPFNGTWMVRATGIPEPTTLAALLLLGLVAYRR